MLFTWIFIGLCMCVGLSEAFIVKGGRKSYYPVPGEGLLKGYCNDDDDCKRGRQCCVMFRRLPKWFRNDPSVRKYAKGKCKSMGRRKSKCLLDSPSTGIDGLYYRRCPCKEKFSCEPNGKRSKYGKKGRCRKIKNKDPWTGQCKTHADCPKSFCCMKRLKGKRGANSRSTSLGNCHPRGGFGDGCHVVNSLPNYVSRNSCPCRAGLHCEGNGQHEHPVGETGTCLP